MTNPFSIAEVMKEMDEKVENMAGMLAYQAGFGASECGAFMDDERIPSCKKFIVEQKSFLLQTLLSCYEDELREVEGMRVREAGENCSCHISSPCNPCMEVDIEKVDAQNYILSTISTRLQKQIQEIKALL